MATHAQPAVVEADHKERRLDLLQRILVLRIDLPTRRKSKLAVSMPPSA
jgi:hypothetical protein